MANKDQRPQIRSSSSTPAQITALYRRNISNFLFYSDACLKKEYPNDNGQLTSWIGDTARSLSLRAVTPLGSDATDTLNGKRKKKPKVKSNAKGVSADDVIRSLPTPNWSDFICMTCGTFLFPPTAPTTNNKDGSNSPFSDECNTPFIPSPLPNNIYLRPMKRGRTRRRRASRAKAKELHSRSLMLQRRGGPNANIELRKDALLKEEMQRIASSYRIGDGRSRHCLVMRCNFCGMKKKRKGMEVKSDKKKSKVIDNDAGRKMRNVIQPKSGGSRVEKRKTVASQIHDNTDFISLSPLGGGSGKKSANANDQQQQHDGRQVNTGERKQNTPEDAFISPLLSSKKKKKKKKAEPKKGDLMDFLSSLND